MVYEVNNKLRTDILLKIKEEVGRELDKRIESSRLSESVEAISDLSLASVIDMFRVVLPSLIESKNGARLIRKYVKTIKEDKLLSEAYRSVKTIKEGHDVKMPYMVVESLLESLQRNNPSKIEESTNKLRKIMTECVLSTGFDSNGLDTAIEDVKTSLNESIDYLVRNKKDRGNIVEWTNHLSEVVSHMEANKAPLDESVEDNGSIHEIMDNLNEVIKEGADEAWKVDLLNDISDAVMNGKSDSVIFEEYKNKCLDAITEAIEGTTMEGRTRLDEMKDSISLKSYNKDTFNGDVVKLCEIMHLVQTDKEY